MINDGRGLRDPLVQALAVLFLPQTPVQPLLENSRAGDSLLHCPAALSVSKFSLRFAQTLPFCSLKPLPVSYPLLPGGTAVLPSLRQPCKYARDRYLVVVLRFLPSQLNKPSSLELSSSRCTLAPSPTWSLTSVFPPVSPHPS